MWELIQEISYDFEDGGGHRHGDVDNVPCLKIFAKKLAFLAKIWHNKHIEKNKKKEEYIYTYCQRKEVMAESFLRKDKWKVAFLVDILRNLKIGISV